MTLATQTGLSSATRRDLRTLATFVHIYCQGKKHPQRHPFTLNNFDVNDLSRKPLRLCPECTKLLRHGIIKRSLCRYDPKPACKDCVTQCYSTAYKMKIREVMKYSGWRLLLTGRIDYLFHLLRRPAHKPQGPRPVTSQIQETNRLTLTIGGRTPIPASESTIQNTG